MPLPDATPGAALLDPLDVQLDGPVPVLRIPDDPEFKVLREWIRAALPPKLGSIAGRACRLDLGERAINLFDVRRLLNLLREEFQLDVTGLYIRPDALHAYAERELKLRLFVEALQWASPNEHDLASADDTPTDPTGDDLPTQVDADDTVVDPPQHSALAIPKPNLQELHARSEARATRQGRRTLNVHRTLRSGATIQFEGDVTVYGDVNPGAQVIAAGNIMVLGALRGMAHAGAMGDDTTFILGFSFKPLQLRIGRKIAIPPDRRADTGFSPEVCHVIDERIVIEPFRGRIPGRPSR